MPCGHTGRLVQVCTDKALFVPVDHLFDRGTGSALIAHLGHQLIFTRRFGQHPRFVDVVRQGFLHIYVFAELHGGHGGHGVGMVGRRNRDGVDAFFFVEHFPKVRIPFGIGKFFGGFLRVFPIDIAKRHNVVGAVVPGIADVGSAFSARTDGREVEFIAGRRVAPSQHVARDDVKTRGGGSGGLEELAAGCCHFSI
jgi:hypothetical protein